MVKLRDGSGGGGNFDDGNDIKTFRFAFDLNFQIEKYRFDSCKQRLKSLFDQVVVAFLRDKSAGKFHRPIPAFCGDGQQVDLFKLFWLVRKFGGYDAVSRNNLWGFISEECGLGCGAIASLKLVYMNYLNELDRWLQQVFSKRVLEDDHCGFIQKLDLLSRELEVRFKGLLPEKQEQEQLEEVAMFVGEANDMSLVMIDDFASSANNAAAEIANEQNGISRGQDDDDGGIIGSAKKLIDNITNKVLNHRETTIAGDENDGESSSPLGKNGSFVSAKKVDVVICRKPDFSEKVPDDEERFIAQPSSDDKITSRSDAGNVLSSRKRKQEPRSFSGMLEWLIQAAKRPGDPSLGSIPECSKWSDGDGEFWAEALFVREALLIRRHASKAAAEVLLKDQQKKQRMLPSMYEDEVSNHQTTEKLRYSRRIPVIKSHSCSCCNSSAAPHSPREADVVRPSEVAATVVKEQPSNTNGHKPCDVPAERKVSVGPQYQAHVPQWTGIASDSDSKWLGTRMWPPEDGRNNSIVKLDPIGKGRQHQCNCSFPDSVECVRFHIAEKRLKLKQELGSLFYRWRFNLMGEEVSLSWTEDEEGIFRDNMKLYAAFSNKFWNNAWRFLPSKSRDKLVSYYFNVYLVQRRSYQNRVNREDVDSDDDEKVCGLIGGCFGHKALYIPRPSSVSCTLNTESTEFV
ncbi:AT-rich interactive domain-containing protein 2-like isoform X1 [Salvia miltiorrhiza]|uniref:AT-rich interactive domain-containing protein 2-like isoform X1 n=2 Tax=Salvia miltiorrhiza TaxID=226208 RepID=UPI0025ABF3B4|nr:AT-rich interactive domain-containing protein 2-like isoform X1 [Salvia miltiorrhiza]